jgi:hypothetical protein
MGGLSFARYFRLRPGAIECEADGLRVGGVTLLSRDAKGAWPRGATETNSTANSRSSMASRSTATAKAGRSTRSLPH